jgi:hypothetical protein
MHQEWIAGWSIVILKAQVEEEEHQNKEQQRIHLVSKSNKGHRFSNEITQEMSYVR